MSKPNSSKGGPAKQASTGALGANDQSKQDEGAEKTATKIIQVPALSVTSSQEGFRRGGRAWSKAAAVVKLSDLTKDQVKQIKGESMLTVTEVEVDEEVDE